MSERVIVEICAGHLESALQAEQGGADRVELCADLAAGGTTPSAGTIAEACRRLSIPVHVLVRPRAGDFIPSLSELDAMRRDIQIAKNLGAAAVVIGALRPDRTIDRDVTAGLADLARPLAITFHKAFDSTREHDEALDTLIALGIDRVLTSGGQATALAGREVLQRLVDRAGGRIAVLAGGQISAADLEPLVSCAGVREVHLGSAVTRLLASTMDYDDDDESTLPWKCVDSARVHSVVELAARLSAKLAKRKPLAE
jgi:copper homeostasis protein